MTKQYGEDKPKKGTGFKVVLILFGIIEIGLIATALAFIIGSISDPLGETSRMWTGLILIYVFAGTLIIFFPIIMISFVMSRRKAITKTFHNITSSALAPYSASYRPSRSGQVYYCDYCGYEVKSHERECPECSGPIKRGKRVG